MAMPRRLYVHCTGHGCHDFAGLTVVTLERSTSNQPEPSAHKRVKRPSEETLYCNADRDRSSLPSKHSCTPHHGMWPKIVPNEATYLVAHTTPHFILFSFPNVPEPCKCACVFVRGAANRCWIGDEGRIGSGTLVKQSYLCQPSFRPSMSCQGLDLQPLLSPA